MKNASDLIEKQLKALDRHFTKQKPQRPTREAEMFDLLAKQGNEPESRNEMLFLTQQMGKH